MTAAPSRPSGTISRFLLPGRALTRLRFQHVLTPSGFGAAEITVDDKGRIAGVEPISGDRWDGWLCLPGMVNAHSHSFQRVLCGWVERSAAENSFWGWREQMYAVAQRCTPEDQYVIACQAFAEMLAAGYTSVGEFHYLHHLPDGSHGTQMADAVVAAAADTGIRLALLPVFYSRGGFDQPAQPAQSRFIYDTVDDFLGYVSKLDAVAGIAPHSLRAVDAGSVAELVEKARQRRAPDLAVHIHIAEQRREVEQCVQATGMTPWQYLQQHCDIDRHWALVHATHMSDNELQQSAASGAVVVACPLTEANLGDGILRASGYVADGGRIAIGSDCNARIDAIEELRLLEYTQRLAQERRVCLATTGLGGSLWQAAAEGGAAALNLAAGAVVQGNRADLVVLRQQRPIDIDDPGRAMDAWLTGGDARQIDAVYVGGKLQRPGAGPGLGQVMQRLGLQ